MNDVDTNAAAKKTVGPPPVLIAKKKENGINLAQVKVTTGVENKQPEAKVGKPGENFLMVEYLGVNVKSIICLNPRA